MIGKRVVRCGGHWTAEMLSTVLTIFPRDTYQKTGYIMKKVVGNTVETSIWDLYEK